MWITVSQIIPDGTQWNEVNTDLVERVRPNPDGSLVLHLQSGFELVISETREWWEAKKTSGGL
jgi:hypothetical protein